jgi:hypothetical protein
MNKFTWWIFRMPQWKRGMIDICILIPIFAAIVGGIFSLATGYFLLPLCSSLATLYLLYSICLIAYRNLQNKLSIGF